MSRGKGMLFALVALTAVSVFVATPAMAASTSDAVAATDERAPDGVTGVIGLQGVAGVEISWELSPSDFVRQSPTGSDFTSGGSFANVNDVAAYNIYRDDALAGSVEAGETLFVDLDAVGSTIVYYITAADAAGNESVKSEDVFVSLGAPPIATISFVVPDGDFGIIAPDGTGSLGFNINNSATATDANLTATVVVTGDGFTVTTGTESDVTEGTYLIPPGNNTHSGSVNFDAAAVGNLNGVYLGSVLIRTNDPENREATYDVVAEIIDGIGLPEISIAPAAVPFAGQIINQSHTRKVTISNVGGPTLEGTVSIAGDAAFSISGDGTYSLGAASAEEVTVTFAPTDSVSYSATITVTSNDADEASTEIAVSGRGTASAEGPGVIEVQKTVINLPFGGTVTIPGLGPINASDAAAVDAFLLDVEAVATATVEMGKAAAAAMGVDPSRIRNGRWIRGSLIFVFDVAPAEAGSSEPTPEEAVTNLQTTLADTTTANAVTAIGEPSPVTTEVVVQILVPQDADGNRIVGWFTKGANGNEVGFDDFFAFADNFGLTDSDPTWNAEFDISSTTGDPDGSVDFDDFFAFADNFGKTVANAAEIIAALQ